MSDETRDNTREISEAIAEIQQSRSRYQLQHFVVGQFSSPEMQFHQICIELQDMEYKLAHATLAVKKGELEISRLRASGDEMDELNAQVKELELTQTRLAMIGAEREVQILREMFAASPKFTRVEIEQAQPEYWQARLTRQYALQQASRQQGVDWGVLDAMDQAELFAPSSSQGLSVVPTHGEIASR